MCLGTRAGPKLERTERENIKGLLQPFCPKRTSKLHFPLYNSQKLKKSENSLNQSSRDIQNMSPLI